MSEVYNLINEFPQSTVLVAGDLILDHFVWGRVCRISPEAPVPVVEIESEDYRLGGAANVVNNVRSLGARVCVTGIVGSDVAGRQLLSMIEQIAPAHGCFVTSNGRPTTTKMRIIAHRQQIVRADREDTRDVEREAFLAMTDYIRQTLPEVNTVIISDYGKGAVTPELVETIVTQVRAENAARQKPIQIIVDPKGRQYSKYKGVDVIKPNTQEAALATGISVDSEAGLRAAGIEILNQTRSKAVLITGGERGMVLFQKNEPTVHIPTLPRETFEVSGAGDTVSAALAVALSGGADLLTACRIANAAAWVVVGKVGIACVTPDELIHALKEIEES